MEILNSYQYSLEDWAKELTHLKISRKPIKKTAVELLADNRGLKISDLTWIKGIDLRIVKFIET